jgi:hypothetical protein
MSDVYDWYDNFFNDLEKFVEKSRNDDRCNYEGFLDLLRKHLSGFSSNSYVRKELINIFSDCEDNIDLKDFIKLCFYIYCTEDNLFIKRLEYSSGFDHVVVNYDILSDNVDEDF